MNLAVLLTAPPPGKGSKEVAASLRSLTLGSENGASIRVRKILFAAGNALRPKPSDAVAVECDSLLQDFELPASCSRLWENLSAVPDIDLFLVLQAGQTLVPYWRDQLPASSGRLPEADALTGVYFVRHPGLGQRVVGQRPATLPFPPITEKGECLPFFLTRKGLRRLQTTPHPSDHHPLFAPCYHRRILWGRMGTLPIGFVFWNGPLEVFGRLSAGRSADDQLNRIIRSGVRHFIGKNPARAHKTFLQTNGVFKYGRREKLHPYGWIFEKFHHNLHRAHTEMDLGNWEEAHHLFSSGLVTCGMLQHCVEVVETFDLCLRVRGWTDMAIAFREEYFFRLPLVVRRYPIDHFPRLSVTSLPHPFVLQGQIRDMLRHAGSLAALTKHLVRTVHRLPEPRRHQIAFRCAGSEAKRLLESTGNVIPADVPIGDSNEAKRSDTICGHPVLSPEEALAHNPSLIVYLTPGLPNDLAAEIVRNLKAGRQVWHPLLVDCSEALRPRKPLR
ncbi:MAG: hypothetical protein HYT87_00655 [Nitrospirae bacterium]|nr:hypothetical protein [Nitrospirota bacterium]